MNNHLLGHGQHARFRSQDHAVVGRDEIARGPKAVAVERCPDLPAVRESDGRGSVPRLHERGVILVKVMPLLVHELIARPCFGDEQHHGVGEAVPALNQEFERVIETSRVGLPFEGDRPQLGNILAKQRRGYARLPGRHPVHIAAQRVDLAIVADHAIRVREPPRREGVRREPLMDERKRRRKARIMQVEVIFAHLIGQEHAFVDDGAAGQRDKIEVHDVLGVEHGARPVRYDPPNEIKSALEGRFICDVGRTPHEDLPVEGLGRENDLRQRLIVNRHIAPAKQRNAFFRKTPRL